jgi:GNAT superfamily N-acetyltransferase
VGTAEIEVLRAVPEHLDALVDCQTTCWREAYTGLVSDAYLYDPQRAARRHQRWARILSGERAAWVAPAGEQIVAVATSGPSRDEPADPPTELMTLYVRAAWHGTGLADQMLAAAIGSKPASLWVFIDNPRARAFYARHGFVATGEQKLDPDTDVMEMRMVRG